MNGMLSGKGEDRQVARCVDRESHWSNGSAKLLPVRKHDDCSCLDYLVRF